MWNLNDDLWNRKCQCYKMNGSGDDRLRNDDATSIASYHIIAISLIGFRHYNLFYIYRAVPFLTLCLMAAESTFADSRVAVLNVAVPISACCRSGCRCSYHDKFRYGTITIQAYRIWKKGTWPVCKTYKSPFYCHKYHQTKWRVNTPYPIITVQK